MQNTGPPTMWLARPDYYAAPKKVKHKINLGESAAPPGYASTFVGWKVEDVAAWLRQKPVEVELNEHFFAILDKGVDDGTVVVCRIGGHELHDPDDLGFVRMDVLTGLGSLSGGPPYWFDEVKGLQGQAEIKY
jgi:hypothetical protein